MAIEWIGPPEQGSHTTYPIFRLHPSASAIAWLLGDPEGVALHWIDGRGTLPCEGKTCRWCPASKRLRYYVAARVRESSGGSWATRIVELSQENCFAVNAITAGKPWRGQFVGLHRGSSPYSRLVIRGAEIPPSWGDLSSQEPPEAPDVRASLLVAWGVSHQRAKPNLTIHREEKAV